MDDALVKNAEDNVDNHQCRRDQDHLARQRREESAGIALERGCERCRLAAFLLDAVNGGNGIAEGCPGRQVE